MLSSFPSSQIHRLSEYSLSLSLTLTLTLSLNVLIDPKLYELALQEEDKMKVIAAYLLAVLAGNTSPSADDLKDILGSGTLSLSLSFWFWNFWLRMGYDDCSCYITLKRRLLVNLCYSFWMGSEWYCFQVYWIFSPLETRYLLRLFH